LVCNSASADDTILTDNSRYRVHQATSGLKGATPPSSRKTFDEASPGHRSQAPGPPRVKPRRHSVVPSPPPVLVGVRSPIAGSSSQPLLASSPCPSPVHVWHLAPPIPNSPPVRGSISDAASSPPTHYDTVHSGTVSGQSRSVASRSASRSAASASAGAPATPPATPPAALPTTVSPSPFRFNAGYQLSGNDTCYPVFVVASDSPRRTPRTFIDR
jgi:hypothetical protein